MSDEVPVVPFTVDRDRLVVSSEQRIVDTPPSLRGEALQRSLRWMVAVAVCPFCGEGHEHMMSQYAGWGRYRAPCDRQRAYCLRNDADQ